MRRSRTLTSISTRLALLAVLATSGLAQAAEQTFVTGRVTGPDAAPLAGAEAHLVAVEGGHHASRRQIEERLETVLTAVRSDAEGRFRLAVARPGVYKVRVEAAGHLAALYQPVPVPVPGSGVELPPLSLRPAEEAVIEFHRRGGSGPVGGAFVDVSSSSRGAPALGPGSFESGWRAAPRSGRTGRDGRLVVSKALGEWLDLALLAPWSEKPRRILGVEGLRYFLDPQPQASGVLVAHDAAGNPLSGVVVHLGAEGIPIGSTDQQGRLEIRGRITEPEPLHLYEASGRRFAGWWVTPPPGIEVVRTLPDLERLEGRAVSIRGRAPLAGALVWSNRDPGLFAVSGDGGRFVLDVPQVRDKTWVEGRVAGFLPALFVGEHRGQWSGRSLELTFEPATRLEGVVVDSGGQPLSGVELRLEADPIWPAFRLDGTAGRAVSDARGRFQLAPVWSDSSLLLEAWKLGFTETRLELERARLGEPLRLVLEVEKAAFGRVVDLEERPISGAVVRAVSTDRRRQRPRHGEGEEPFAGVTDEEGRFELAALPAEVIDLLAERQGYAPMKVRGVDVSPPPVQDSAGPAASESSAASESPATTTSAPDTSAPDTSAPDTSAPEAPRTAVDLGTLLMEPGARIEGLVVDDSGQPVEQASVWRVGAIASSLRNQLEKLQRQDPETSSDEEGFFSLEDLPAGTRLDLVVHRTGFRPAPVEGVEVPDAESGGGGDSEGRSPLEIVLKPAATVSGRVVDEAGEGITGASLSLNPYMVEPGALEPTDLDGDDLQSVSTDEDGHYFFDVVTPGKYSVLASSNAHQSATPVDVQVAPRESLEDLDFVLEEGAVLSGFTLTEDGEPLRGVRIIAGDSYDISGPDGRFRVLGITPGTQVVEGRFEGLPRVRLELDIRLGEQETELVFSLGVEVEGQVTDAGGQPLGGVWVSINGGDLYAEYAATSDGDGRFALEGVGPGDYRLRAVRRGFAPFLEDGALQLGDSAKRDVRVILEDAGTITGRLVGLEFEELERVVVTAGQGPHEANAEIDFEGRYRLEDLARGDWLVRAEVPGTGREAQARVPLGAGEEATRDLDFTTGFELSGSVWWNGSPLTATSITVRGLDAAVERRTRSDHEGAFRLANLPPGQYRLDAANARELLTQNLDLVVDGDRQLTIEFDTVRVSGRVVAEEDGRPLDDVLVLLNRHLEGSSEPGSLTTITTRADGVFEFGRLSRGSYTLTVRHDGFVPHTRELQVAADVGPLDLSLDSATGLDLVVRRSDGGVPPYVFVSVLGADGRPRFAEGRDLGADGVARLPNLPAGTWRLWLSSPGAVPRQVDVEVPSEAPVPVELEPAGRVVVRVDSLVRSGAAATVQLIGPDGSPWRAFDVDTGSPQEAWRVVAGTAEVDGVPPGQWTVRIESVAGGLWESPASTSGGLETRVMLD